MERVFKEIIKDIYLVSTSLDANFPNSYCFYLDDEIKTLIDTPLNPGFTELLKNRPLDRILNSHFHRDHCGCNYLFPSTEIHAHPLDIPAMMDPGEYLYAYGMDEYANHDEQQRFLSWANYHPSPQPLAFQDGQVWAGGKYTLQAVHTPGHSRGHTAFYMKEHDVLFSADIDLTSFGPWYGNVTCDLPDFIASIRKIGAMKPGALLSSHKGLIDSRLDERLDRYIGRILSVSEKILDYAVVPRSLGDLVEQRFVYGRWPDPVHAYRLFEMTSIRVQLQWLTELRLVEQSGHEYRATGEDRSRLYK